MIDGDNIIKTIQKNFTNEDRLNIKKIIIDSIVNMVYEILNESNIELNNIEKIGIASPGLISGKTLVKSSNLGIENFEISKILEEKFAKEVKLRNDAKCSALAEKEYGTLKNYNDCIFICIGTGIGGAAFMSGKMLEPSKFSGFEFGHMVIEKGGRQCSCGKKGCFETYASIKALKEKVVNILDERDDVSGKYLREELLIKDNEGVRKEIESFLEYLKVGVGNLIDIFEPEAICFGGSFAYYEGNPILDKLIKKLNEDDVTFTISKKPDIVIARYKNDSGIIGATL